MSIKTILKGKKNELLKLSISLAPGLLLGLGAIIFAKKFWVQIILIFFAWIISSLGLKFYTDLRLKNLSKVLKIEIGYIESGDFSRTINETNHGILNKIVAVINKVISEAKEIIKIFISFNDSIKNASNKIDETTRGSNSSMEEIAKTVDEIAKGASNQAQEAQIGVERVEKLSEQINF